MTLNTLLEPFRILRKFANIFESKGGVHDTGDKWEKFGDRNCFHIFLEAIRLQYTIIERFFQKRSFQSVGKLIFVQQFHGRCSWHGVTLSVGVDVTGENLIAGVMESGTRRNRRCRCFTGDKHKVANTVSQRIFVKFEMTSMGYLGAQRSLIHEKNRSRKKT